MTCSAWSQCCRFSRCGSILTLCATWHGAPRCSSCLSTQPAQLASAGALPLWKHGLLCFALGQGWQCGSQKSQSLEGGCETGAGAEFNFSNLKSSAKWSQAVLGRSYRAREHQTLAAQGAGLQSARLAPPSGPSPPPCALHAHLAHQLQERRCPEASPLNFHRICFANFFLFNDLGVGQT